MRLDVRFDVQFDFPGDFEFDVQSYQRGVSANLDRVPPGVVRESDARAGDDLPEALAVTWGTNEGMALPWPGVLLVTLPGMAKTWRSCAPGAPLTMNRRGD